MWNYNRKDDRCCVIRTEKIIRVAKLKKKDNRSCGNTAEKIIGVAEMQLERRSVLWDYKRKDN